MPTQVPWLMLVTYFAPFALWCDSVIVDNGCLLTVGNDCYGSSVGENFILSETGDVSVTKSSNVPMLDSESSGYKSL